MKLWSSVIHPVTTVFRRRRGRLLLAQFPQLATMRVCDVGGSRHFWEKVGLPVDAANLTIYNISHDEVGAGGPRYAQVPVLLYDGQRLPVPDGHFDLVVCNSVIEHVPPAQREAFARELQRVGQNLFCQTPNFWFPLEPHFLLPFVHWLPRALGRRIIAISPWRLLSRPSRRTMDEYWHGTQLLTTAELRRLFPQAAVVPEKIAGWAKSLCVVQQARPRVAARPAGTGADAQASPPLPG